MVRMVADPPRPPPPAINGTHALFLDVDGTLLEFAAHPDDVRVPGPLRQALDTLHLRLGGAVALVSGRPLDVLDALFAPLVLPAAGLHGLELRNGDSARPAPEPPPGGSPFPMPARPSSGDGWGPGDPGTSLVVPWVAV